MRPLTQIERWQKAWAVLLPHVPVPSTADAAYWQRFPQEWVDKAMLRCSRRYAPDMIRADFTPADAYKYVTFVANESVKAERKKVLAELQFSDNVTSPVTDGAEVDDDIGNRA